MENNELFKQIRDTVEKWRPENERRFRERKKLIRKYGESSPEFTEWERNIKANPFPVPRGTIKALHASEDNIENGTDEFEWAGFTLKDETEDFLKTLRSAGIKTMVVTGTSTEMMGNLHAYAHHGCTMMRLCTVTRKNQRESDGCGKEVHGIRFKIN